MDQTSAKVELQTMLLDTLQQVSDDRLTSAVVTAWRDGYVATQVHDETLVYDSSVYTYTLPSTVSVVGSIGVRTSTGTPADISAELYHITDGKIYFTHRASSFLSTGDTLVITGKYKLASTDSIPDTEQVLHDYVINLATWIVLKQMGVTKILSFLHNDTSMSELINFRREVERDVKALRAQLATTYMDN